MLIPLVIAAIIGCAGDTATKTITEVNEPASEFTAKMKLHYELATEARNAVISGEVSKVKAAAAKLRDTESPKVPESWEPGLKQMKDAATQLAGVTDVDAAGEGVARLAQSCAACHAVTGGGPIADVNEAMKMDHAKGEVHMSKHLWAADGMWLGLVGPSDKLFDKTAAALAETHLHALAQEGVEDVPEEFKTLEMQIHELAASAAKSHNAEERAKLYGHFLGNCARCHTMMEIKPTL